MNSSQLWKRYLRHLCVCESLGLTIDVSRMRFADDFFDRMTPAMDRAFDAMAALERGEIANPDEDRMVGHYWLRAPSLAPRADLRDAIEQTTDRIKTFAADVHLGRICPPEGQRFENVLVVGIGGSALGPQLVSAALGSAGDPLQIWFLDNTDPDGFDVIFDQIGEGIERTLVLVISKSGGTVETRNAMLETMRRFDEAGVHFPAQAVAITQEGSKLYRLSKEQDWLANFPMWDWVGGRTSETSAVGLLPAALQGFDIDAFLAGAAEMDAMTRGHDARKNPAALLALMWHYATDGRGTKDMVIIPYKDRLSLLARYLQQLVMESLGKELDLGGQQVCQGLTVYGNKGSTDQHAYVQQLREGVRNFFVTFLAVRRDRAGRPFEVEESVTSGDYLHGFLLGTRQALYEKERDSLTITVDELGPRTLGALVALYERAVGLYAFLVNINAYHQPGVEAGKRAAAGVIELQRRLLNELQANPDVARTAEQMAHAVGSPEDIETAHHILEHLAANPERGVVRTPANDPGQTTYAGRQSC